jgi:hypothetical protein
MLILSVSMRISYLFNELAAKWNGWDKNSQVWLDSVFRFSNLVFLISSIMFNNANWVYEIYSMKFVLYGSSSNQKWIMIVLYFINIALVIFFWLISGYICKHFNDSQHAQNVGDKISACIYLLMILAFILTGVKFYSYIKKMSHNSYKYIKNKVIVSMTIMWILFLWDTVFHVLSGFTQFDKSLTDSGWSEDRILFALYYFSYVVIFDLTPKLYILYTVHITINQTTIVNRNNLTTFEETESYTSSVVKISDTQEMDDSY